MENNEGKIYTYGPLIHNNTVVEELGNKGISQLSHLDDLKENDTIIIRSHGVSKQVMELLKTKGAVIVDATCPYVESIHKKVSEYYGRGYQIIIIGDPEHPEVEGINGWCENSSIIVSTKEQAGMIDRFSKICIVSQTTMDVDKWEQITCSLINSAREIVVFNTICNATEQRQKAAADLAGKCDAVVVLGGYNSSNTRKLYEICRKICPNTFHVENISELDTEKIINVKTLGITAGASTPDWIIKEAIDKMSDVGNTNEEMVEKCEENTLMDEYEKTLIRLHDGDLVKGRIIFVTEDEATVDVDTSLMG
jgi:4-hydroxy-3-methylbut-2-enyl diphosphate reductase